MYVLFIYFALGIFSLLYCMLNVDCKDKVTIYIFVGIALFFLFRFNVGQDIRTYLLSYERVTNPITDSITYNANRNFGFTFLIYLCKKIVHSYPVFILVTNGIVLLCISYIIFKYSKNILLSMLMFVGSGYLEVYYGSGLRQSIAMAIFLFIFYEFIPKKQYLKYYIGAILACLFHEAALVTLFIPIIHKYSHKIRKNYIKVGLISIASAVVVSYIVGYLAPKIALKIGFSDAITHLALYFMTQSFSILGIGMEIVLTSLCIILYYFNDMKDDWTYFQAEVAFFALLVYILMIRYPLVSRVCDLLQVIFIILIPNLIQSIASKKKQLLSFIVVFLLNGFLLYVDISEKSRKTGYSVKEFPYISIFETEKIENFLYDE